MMRSLLNLFVPQTEKVSDDWKRSLDAEGVLCLIEDVPTTVTFRNYSRPGKYSAWNRKSLFATAMAVTNNRLIAFCRGKKVLNLPFDSDNWNDVSITMKDENTLRIVANVTAFPNNHNGEVTFWFQTSFARTIVHLLAEQLS